MTTSDTLLTVGVATIVGLVSSAVTFFLGVKNLRNSNAGGDKSISEAWSALIAPMQNRITEQTREIEVLKGRVDALELKDGVSQTIIIALNAALKRERAQKDLYYAQLHAHSIEPMDVGPETKG